MSLQRLLLCAAQLVLVGCAGTNAHVPPDAAGATLQNRIEHRGQARLSFFYVSVDSGALKPGWTTAESVAAYRIPAGPARLELKVVYTPRARGGFASALNEYYLIHVLRTPSGNPDGIFLNATAGETYTIDCRIEDGRAFVWIEDSSAVPVTDEVPGFGLEAGHYWVWRNLPPLEN
ncbi:MAG: hypothetical protein OEQ14_19225 [Gammaproteobacteria bacterium]|nr:hypothetical protein [Gammaproteobacteria bacterium]